jgi:membrane associated rhomboid family serine protease
MIEAPVGYQCPRCADGGAPVQRMVDVLQHAPLTRALVYVIAGLFVVTMVSRPLLTQFGLVPALVGTGRWWLLVTSAFLHVNLIQAGFNGLLLWQLGHMLEPALGRARFGALYAAGIAGGSLGVVLLAWATVATPLLQIPLIGRLLATSPLGVTVGASGAVFALMGAAMVGMRARGINPWQTSIGTLVLLNLVLTFAVSGISVGGHVGGLLAGAAAGKLLFVGREEAASRARLTAGLAVAMFALAIVLATALLA